MLSSTAPLQLVAAFFTTLVLGLSATYVVRDWAIRRGYVDVPGDARRIHSKPTPNVGGVAIALVATVSFVAWSSTLVPGWLSRRDILSMLLGGLLVFAVGFWDDTRGLSPWVKFALECAIGVGVFLGGVRILGGSLGSVWHGHFGALISLIVTVFWIVGTTNAFNLIDGSDGVAAGAVLFASGSLAFVFAIHGNELGALMAVILVGASMGFLFFNFPPASIFLGDSGSLFLGYTLASLAVITTEKASTAVAVAIPIVAFGVPLLDTAMAIVRRFLRREPIFSPDRGHIHHRLSDLGHSPRGVAILLYVAFAGFGALSLSLAAPGRPTTWPVFVVAAAVLVLGVQRLNVPEISELIRVLGRGFQQRSVISHNVRLRAACDALETATDGEAVVEALELAFHGGEFARLEVWVPQELCVGLVGAQLPNFSPQGPGYFLVLRFESPLEPEQEVEIRASIWDDGKSKGRLSLYRTSAGERLYTDIRLIPELLIPAFVRSLKRLARIRTSVSPFLAGHNSQIVG